MKTPFRRRPTAAPRRTPAGPGPRTVVDDAGNETVLHADQPQMRVDRVLARMPALPDVPHGHVMIVGDDDQHGGHVMVDQ